jgi:hypothetical protein
VVLSEGPGQVRRSILSVTLASGATWKKRDLQSPKPSQVLSTPDRVHYFGQECAVRAVRFLLARAPACASENDTQFQPSATSRRGSEGAEALAGAVSTSRTT